MIFGSYIERLSLPPQYPKILFTLEVLEGVLRLLDGRRSRDLWCLLGMAPTPVVMYPPKDFVVWYLDLAQNAPGTLKHCLFISTGHTFSTLVQHCPQQ